MKKYNKEQIKKIILETEKEILEELKETNTKYKIKDESDFINDLMEMKDIAFAHLIVASIISKFE